MGVDDFESDASIFGQNIHCILDEHAMPTPRSRKFPSGKLFVYHLCELKIKQSPPMK